MYFIGRADVKPGMSALADDNLTPLQRYNSTPDLLDDSGRSSKLSQGVTSHPNDVRSLRDVIAKYGGGHEAHSGGRPSNLLTARNVLGGSTGNLLDAPRKSPVVRPPPPVRGLSTLSTTHNEQQQQEVASHSGHGQTREISWKKKERGSAGNVLEPSNYDFHSNGRVPPPGKPAGRSRPNSGNVNPSTSDQRNNGRVTNAMKRFGSEDNLLSATSSGPTVPSTICRLQADRQRLVSDDLPPPPSPSTLVGIQHQHLPPSSVARPVGVLLSFLVYCNCIMPFMFWCCSAALA